MTSMSTSDKIKQIYSEYNNYLFEHFYDLAKFKKLNYAFAYSILLFDYGLDMVELNKQTRYASILALGRDFLECYRHCKSLLEKYPTPDDYSKYVRFLYANDMEQDRKIYNSITSSHPNTGDPTFYSDMGKQTTEIINGITRTIETIFPERKDDIDPNNLWESLRIIIEDLFSQYKHFDADKARKVGEALKKNSAYMKINEGKPIEGCYTIYRLQCHATHSSISSVIERTIKDGIFTFNNKGNNIDETLLLVLHCLQDILDDTKQLISP